MAKLGCDKILKTLKYFLLKTNFLGARTLWKKFLRKRREAKRELKKKLLHHLNSYSLYPWYKTNWDLKQLLETELPGFVKWATIHYNTQLLAAGRGEDDPAWAKNMYDSQLDLAANYIQRNRSRLFEWWCLRDGETRWLSDADMIELDLGRSFDALLPEKLKRDYGIDGIKPDKNYYTCGTSVINEDGTLNTWFIKQMKLNHWLGRARFGVKRDNSKKKSGTQIS